ncbi:SpoVR family protein [Numidum massiliense]|uniref:SpoVR family protein n=1 Tax=Numidum massiliense TaxID=1522315 RepID=UPI0006D59505|nr:SpoVR family protein [Numidum massiliense]
MAVDDRKKLERAIAEITEIARGFKLDFFPMRYEICPSDIIYTFGAYGMPTRFSHWSFGKAFHKMKLQYDFNLSKIYELVINSNPCYAFLLEGNSLIQNKLIVAHVLAHSDFFKNNAHFRNTKRDMVESMAASAERIRDYEIRYGKDAVERCLDAVLAINEHVDPSLLRPQLRWNAEEAEERDLTRDWRERGERSQRSEPYEELWALDEQEKQLKREAERRREQPRKFPPEPEKDLLLFIQAHSPILEDWQRDILTILWEEMLYFWPQLETKVMNEGWASYWHARILRELDLTEEETIEFSMLNASVIQPARTSINPYHLGVKIFEDIEKRWDNPTEEEQRRFGRKPGQGREKIFEVREIERDTSFIRDYLTKDLLQRLDLFLFQKHGNDWIVSDKEWQSVRDQLVAARVNGGFPYITVEDGDYLQNGELYLKHQYEGLELDVKHLEKVLPYVHELWGRVVHLETTIEERHVLFTCDGKKTNRRLL